MQDSTGTSLNTILFAVVMLFALESVSMFCESHCLADQPAGDGATSSEREPLKNDAARLLSIAQQKFAAGQQFESDGSQACVDNYFLAAGLSWHSARKAEQGSGKYDQAIELYDQSISRLIVTGQTYKRLDPRSRMLINSPSGLLTIPVTHTGFPWQPRDFSRIEPAGTSHVRDLNHVFRTDGIGVPAIVTFVKNSQSDVRTTFVADNRPFSATVLLMSDIDRLLEYFRPNGTAETPDERKAPIATLQLFNPLSVDHVRVGNENVTIARDLTAPIAHMMSREPSQYLQGFLQPGNSSETARLLMIEPYQADKIPIVFVHGLLSDRLTWANLANEIRGRPELARRYQLWIFQYPTGRQFLQSAAHMRAELWRAYEMFSPHGQHELFSQTVLIGHSMGGLMSKLQVADSGSMLWDSISRKSFDQVRMSSDERARSSEAFFFDPLPFVQRVIFIGTPHEGSSFARRPVGLVGDLLIRTPREDQWNHRRLMLANPLNFVWFARRRPPTSIDLLKPGNPLLETIRCLPINQSVHLHSVIGTGRRMLIGGPADGVVPITSARHRGVDDELYVNARHEELHSHPATISYIAEILSRHAVVVNVVPVD